ncbi:unnamed protein product [Gongylonema pulchrum]|uniref:Ovule protein n=1 Tax=Gongylonema pulchrum TaxID=637853 RepID=A0A183ER75_9BILA|nr:unnamed protein product [Gongylonema pulchrum]
MNVCSVGEMARVILDDRIFFLEKLHIMRFAVNGLLCYWKKSWDIRAGCNNIGRRMSSGNIPLEGRTRLPGKVQDCIQDCGLIVAHIQSASHSNEVGSC